jgi:NADH:ubiquinone oxidoreductase subunit 5 (subunit L)/multisubunit Na+/H+ antiporter MnhA subunit
MPISEATAQALLILIPGLPTLAVLALGITRWATGQRAAEPVVGAIVALAFGSAAFACALLGIHLFASGSPGVEADLGSWFSVGHYRFRWLMRGDRLSLPFALFSSLLVGVIGAFSRRYLHREDGFHRFYLMLAFFGAGVLLVVLAGSLDLFFFGWEIVGLTSALLIAFFHERPKPVDHGLRAFVTYRACDVGLLGAAVWLHHTVGSSALAPMVEGTRWSGLPVPVEPRDALVVGLLLLWACIGKSAQVPLGGWLPRAMEGPTPSSAIFYGAISVSLGPYLLLRSLPILESAPAVRWAVIAVGATTALHATFVGRVQSDIKSALAYASMTQLGLIFVEIGLGLPLLALIHTVGHASIRSLQILRSPSLLHDHHHLEQAMGRQLPRTGGHLERLVPRSLQPWLYRHALERGYLDAILVDWVVGGFFSVLGALDRLEVAWADWLGGERRERRPSSPDPDFAAEASR